MSWKGIVKVIYHTPLQNLNGSLSKNKVLKGLGPGQIKCTCNAANSTMCFYHNRLLLGPYSMII